MQERNLYEDIQNEVFIRLIEKERVKKTAFKIGIAYLLLLFIPMLFSYLFVWGASFFRFNTSKVLSDPAFQNIWQITVSITMMIIPAIFLIKAEKRHIGEIISFGKPEKKLFLPFILIGVGVCAFANSATNVIAIFLEDFGIYYSAPSLAKPNGFFGTILLIISTAITPALVEEFLMRGAVLGSLKKFGEDIAVLISAVMFSLMHANILQIPFAFIVGLILGFAAIKTGSIWTGIAIHFINNFMSVLLSDLLTFGGSDIIKNATTTIYFAISLLLAFVGILMIPQEEKDAFKLEKGEMRATFKEKLGWFLTSPAIIICIAISVLMTAEIL